MKKRLIPLALALLCLLAANVNLYYRVSVNGQAQQGLYSRAALERCETLAQETAEEILREPARLPELKKRPHLSLRHFEADEALLTDALIRSVAGVRLCDGVFVNGTRLGTVADGELLMEKLRAFIRGQMPNAAVFGNISGRVQIQRVYARDGNDTPDEDMILLITGMAPVIYVDGSGKLV